MPELRHDPLTGSLVVMAPERAARPDTFRVRPAQLPSRVEDCPFCPGNEALTPPEVDRRGPGAPDTPGWTTRIVPNLFPLVGSDEMPSSFAAGLPATGAHEVIVLSPAHDASLADLTSDATVEMFGIWRDRSAHHLGAGRAHAAPFVNHGKAAGASIEHPHAQLVAIDFQPPALRQAIEAAAVTRRDLVAQQVADAIGSEHLVVPGPAPAFCPVASTYPYEMLIAHRSTRARFDEATDPEIEVVARAVHEALRRLRALLGDVAYNLVVNTAGTADAPNQHWHVRIAPRVAIRAGFEIGTGLAVNIVSPEAAAAALREATP